MFQSDEYHYVLSRLLAIEFDDNGRSYMEYLFQTATTPLDRDSTFSSAEDCQYPMENINFHNWPPCVAEYVKHHPGFLATPARIVKLSNRTQMMCYIFLKFIMETSFDTYVDEAKSSYIVKSLSFHLIGLENEGIWSDRNLMLFIKVLLDLFNLKVFYSINNVQENLIVEKINIEQRDSIFRDAQRLSSDRWQALLGISSCNFGEKLLLKCSPFRFRSPFESFLADGGGRRCMSMQDIEQLWCMGRAKKAFVLEECQGICSSIQKISDKILLVWPAYDANDDTKLGFVVITTEEVNVQVNYRTYQKVVNMLGGEGRVLIENHSNPESNPLQRSQAENIREKINQHAKTLFQNHTFISGITGSGSRFVGVGARNLKQIPEPCIVTYVLVKGKLPLNEGQIPKYIDNIPVDIREGVFKTCAFEEDKYYKYLRMGCQIMSSANVSQVGTLGGFVEHKDYGLCGLTCGHVVANDIHLHDCRRGRDHSIKDDIFVYQPNTNRQKHRVGPLRRIAYRPGGDGLPGVDLALFQIESRPPETGMFPNYSDSKNLLYESGKFAGEKQFHIYDQKVVKFGRTSGLTEGYVEFSGTVVRKIDFNREYTVGTTRFTYTLFNQLEIRPPFGKKRAFCEGGDSGAFVFKTDVTGDLVCIGMVVGTLSTGNGIVTPISAIMNELGVSEMKTFTLNKTRLVKQFERMEEKIDRLGNQVQRMEQTLARIDSSLNNKTTLRPLTVSPLRRRSF